MSGKVLPNNFLNVPENTRYGDTQAIKVRRMKKLASIVTKVEDFEEELGHITDLTATSKRPRMLRAVSTKKIKKHQTEKTEKLKLTWKNGNEYIMAKRPQTCFEELKGKTIKKQVKERSLQLHVTKNSGTEKANLKPHSSSTCSRGSLLDEVTTFRSLRVVYLETNENETKDCEPHTDHSGEMVSLPKLTKCERTVSSGDKNQTFRQKRCTSKKLFSTKKNTGNQEQHLFGYQSTDKSKWKLQAKKRRKVHDVHSIIQPRKGQISRCGPRVPDLKDIIPARLLMKAFFSEKFLNLKLEGSNADKIRQLYRVSISNRPLIANFIVRHPQILSKKIFKQLIAYKKENENTQATPTQFISSGSDYGNWRAFYISSLTPPSGTVLIELEHDMPLYANYYKTLIARRGESVEINEELVKETKKSAIRDMILHKTIQLRMARTTPDSPVRLEMMSIMATAAYNDVLLNLLVQTIDDWLDQLTKSLFSPYNSVREETCQVLCFMIGSYSIMKALYLSRYFDVVHDLTKTLFRAMETYDDTFENYYITLAHLIHYCPSRGFLDCLIERHLSFRTPVLIRMWPRLMYYAFRYWPNDSLCIKSRLYGKKVVAVLEAAIQKPLTAKFARHALYYVQLRQRNVSRIFSIHSDKAEVAHFLKRGF